MSNSITSVFGSNAPESEDPRKAELIARRADLLGPAYRLFYDEPVHLVRGEGVWLYDADGEAYLDAYNNVPSVGHCHPKVVEALTRQAGTLNTHTRYLHENILEYGAALLATLPVEIERLMLTCTGSEANDLALRIANAQTGGMGIVVTDLAYHGVTMAVAEMSPSFGLTLPPHVRTVAPPDAYRRGSDDLGQAFASDVAAAFSDLEANGIKPAAFVFDSIFTSDGVFADPAGFMGPAVDAARTAGALVIADEVQPGFCRTGDAFWGFQRHGYLPDIVTMGKPMGGGHPVAGLAARAEVLDDFGNATRYFNTYGGNPVSCAVGMTVLEVIREEGLQENAAEVGNFLRQELRDFANRHHLIGDVRGAGLMIGVELVRDRTTKTYASDEAGRLVNGLRRRKVLISRSGPGGNILKIRPPLPFSRDNAALLLERMDEALKEITISGV
jgi:4-aminobutyrate aminotransferase-like enzyme